MKKIYLACACYLFITACDFKEKEPLVQQSKIPVQFAVCLNEEVLPFTVTRGVPPLDITEPEQEEEDTSPGTNEKGIEELSTTIEYIVYQDETGKLFKHERFTLDDDDFGIIYDSLPAGNYTIAVLAHSSPIPVLSEQIMQFGQLSDTFHALKEIEIEPGEEVDDSFVLKRIISKIEFLSTYPVPGNQKSFTMEVSRHHPAVNVVTGKGEVSEEPYLISYEFTPEDIGQVNFIHDFLTFIPESEQEKLRVVLTAKNTADKITRERTVSSIKPVANRIIRYSGLLYTLLNSDDTLSLSVSDGGEWESMEENELED